MVDLWNSLPYEVRASVVVIVLWLAGVVAGKTANPFDNMIVSWLRRKWIEAGK